MKPNAKDLIIGYMAEGETPEGDAMRAPRPPAGSVGGGGLPRPRPMHGARPMGRPPGPPRMHAGPDESALKDIMLLFLTESAGNDYDGAIVRKLIEGQELDRGELQHILDEGARVNNLPPQLTKMLDQIHAMIQRMP